MPKYSYMNDAVSVSNLEAMQYPIEGMSTEQALEAWMALDSLYKAIEKRKEDLRERLLEEVTATGKTLDTGDKTLEVEGTLITKQQSVAKLPDAEGVAALCTAKSMDAKDMPFDKVTVTTLNVSRVEDLVSRGVLSKSEVDDLHSVTFSLKVAKSAEANKVLGPLLAMAKKPSKDSPKKQTRKVIVGNPE